MNSALYIDGDNIQLNQDKLNLLLTKIKTENNVIIKKVFADWKIDHNNKIWSEISIKHGLEEIQVTRISGKDSTDIKIITDLMEDLLTINHIEKFILLGSDKDYIPLIEKVHKYNKKFDVFGLFGQTSDSIINKSSNYYEINDYIDNQNQNHQNQNNLITSIQKKNEIKNYKLLFKYIPKDGISEKKLKRKIRDKNIIELNNIDINKYLQNKNYFKLMNQNNKIIIFKK